MNVLDGRDSYLRTIAQINDERAAAKPIINAIRNSGNDLWDIDIPPSWRTAGFVQELTSAAYDILEANPRESLNLAQLALAIATSIPEGTYPSPIQAQIEGGAWKEIGTAHKYMSEYDAALRAYDAADRAFSAANALAHDHAIVEFARAIVLADLERYDEARQILKEVEPVFRSFGDQRRLVHVKILLGNLYIWEQRWEEGRKIIEAALQEVQQDDLYGQAALHGNLGIVFGGLKRYGDAMKMFYKAVRLYSELGTTVEVSRCHWSMARLLLEMGAFDKAAEVLESARATFVEKGIPEEAGLAGLDLVDAWIALGKTAQARELVSMILAEFTAARLNNRALSALAYLRDVLTSTPQPAKVVRHVRDYVDRLRKQPSLLFLPLPE